MENLLKKLAGGSRQSTGRTNEVVADVLRDHSLFPDVFAGLVHGDPVVRMRAADAVEKIALQAPELLHPYKDLLLHVIARLEQQEIRWHVARMLPRLDLEREEIDRAVEALYDYLSDPSTMVRAFAMQALSAFAERDRRVRHDTIKLLREMIDSGSPAMRSRGKMLLAKLVGLEICNGGGGGEDR